MRVFSLIVLYFDLQCRAESVVVVILRWYQYYQQSISSISITRITRDRCCKNPVEYTYFIIQKYLSDHVKHVNK